MLQIEKNWRQPFAFKAVLGKGLWYLAGRFFCSSSVDFELFNLLLFCVIPDWLHDVMEVMQSVISFSFYFLPHNDGCLWIWWYFWAVMLQNESYSETWIVLSDGLEYKMFAQCCILYSHKYFFPLLLGRKAVPLQETKLLNIPKSNALIGNWKWKYSLLYLNVSGISVLGLFPRHESLQIFFKTSKGWDLFADIKVLRPVLGEV